MANRSRSTILSGFVIACAILAVHFRLSSSLSSIDFSGDYFPARSTCTGSISDCLLAGQFEMESEINRRILATTQYISYGALKRDSVPCSRRGASYYNCRPGAEANPYSRGCSAITRCRS